MPHLCALVFLLVHSNVFLMELLRGLAGIPQGREQSPRSEAAEESSAGPEAGRRRLCNGQGFPHRGSPRQALSHPTVLSSKGLPLEVLPKSQGN